MTGSLRRLVVLGIALAIGALVGQGIPSLTGAGEAESVPGQVLVRYAEGAQPATAASLVAGARKASYNPLLDLWRLDLPKGVSVNEAVSQLSVDPAVLFAQPNYVYGSQRAPDDPRYQTDQHPYYGAINAQAAWDIETGNESVVVAVLDGGVDIYHPELDEHIWANAEETVNGLDDDGNGCIDDVNGCSLLSTPATGDIGDQDGHGTFVSGIIGAESNNGEGVAGVAWDATIMPVRILDPGGAGTTEQLASGILYAAQNGARIENLSLALTPVAGHCPTDPLVEDALRQAHDDLGAVIVAAAGNFDLSCVSFPASSDYAIAVSASGPPEDPDTRAFFSQWGPEVDVAAPGIDIVSTMPGNEYGSNLGTSFATPVVAGVAALLLSHDPSMSNEEVAQRLRDTARDLPDDQHPNWDGAGLVDAAAALGGPSAFAYVDARAPGIEEISLWLEVGDPGAPACRVALWQRPSLSGESLHGGYGAGECSSYWPPTARRPWRLRGEYAGQKAATLQAWSLRAGDVSCSATGLPTAVPHSPDDVSSIDCLLSGVVANDEPGQARAVEMVRFPVRFEMDVRHATARDDPNPSCAIEASRSVWYKLPPTGSPQEIVIDTFGSDYDTVVALHRGDPSQSAEVTCNDQFNGPQSRLVWRLDGESTYYVMVSAYQEVPAGELRISFSRGSIPANDTAGEPRLVEAGGPPVVQPAHSATKSKDDPPVSCVGLYGYSLWFETTASATGQLTLDSAGSNYNTVVAVLDDGGELACNNDASPGKPTSRVSWPAEAGHTYRILAGAFGNQAGGALRLALTAE